MKCPFYPIHIELHTLVHIDYLSNGTPICIGCCLFDRNDLDCDHVGHSDRRSEHRDRSRVRHRSDLYHEHRGRNCRDVIQVGTVNYVVVTSDLAVKILNFHSGVINIEPLSIKLRANWQI